MNRRQKQLTRRHRLERRHARRLRRLAKRERINRLARSAACMLSLPDGSAHNLGRVSPEWLKAVRANIKAHRDGLLESAFNEELFPRLTK